MIRVDIMEKENRKIKVVAACVGCKVTPCHKPCSKWNPHDMVFVNAGTNISEITPAQRNKLKRATT